MLGNTKFHEVAAGGATTHIHTSGSGSDVFVLVHGIGVSSRYFRPLARELSHGGTVHNVDLPGHGRVPKPERPLGVADYARVVWAALDRLGIERPVLVGHSMGAQVVAEMARSRRPAAVALLGPTCNAAERTVWWQSARLAQDTLREGAAVNMIVFSDYWFRCGMSWYTKTLPALLGNGIEEALPEVDVPVLVLRGSRDPIVPRDWTAQLARLCRDAELVEVPEEPHVAMYRGAAEVAQRLRDLAVRARSERP